VEEQIQNESKSTKTVIIVIIAVLITALLVGVGVFAYQQDVIKKNMIEADEQIKKLQEQINCKGTWDDNECNTAPKITLLFPKGGETICDNNPLTIKWDATYYDGLVTMRLLNGGSTGIGPGQRAEKGEYLWENVREIADNLSGGGAEDTYRVRINLQELNFNDDDAGSFDISKFLTIKNCINEDIDKPIDTSDWTTYQNEDLGVEFNHPPELGNFVD
jgi:archaellum component FlaG (FlaF/FlaG flagellin family)